MEGIKDVAFCSHCGNKSPQRLLHSQECSYVDYLGDGRKVDGLTAVYFVAVCGTCNHILVYRAIESIPKPEDFTNAVLIFPDSGRLHRSIPAEVADIYQEAFRIREIAPNAFAVQIRRALEALCEDRGARKGTLHRRLSDLVARNEIPEVLAEVTDVLRLLGNIGAHANTQVVEAWQVHTIDEFFRAVVEYVYVAPSKLQEFQQSLEMCTPR